MLKRLLFPLVRSFAEKRCALCAAVIQHPPVSDTVAAPAQNQFGAPPRRPHAGPHAGPGICADCAKTLPMRASGYCLRCGEFTVSPNLPPGVCGECTAKAPPWERLFFYGAYAGTMRRLLHGLKFGQELDKARVLAGLMLLNRDLAALLAARPVLVPVPLHQTRLRDRGFNQSLELARHLAANGKVTVNHALLTRNRQTRRQSGLTRAQRKTNLQNAFTATSGAKGLHILLVDDVLTTGSTALYAAKALLRAGASRVDVAVAARTPGKNTMSPFR